MSLLDRSIRGNIASPSGTSEIDLGGIAYSNPRLPTAFNGNAENVLNYIMATLYPNYIATVADVASLPLTANPNDYYIVSDDGDTKSAGYVWVIKDNAGGWEKKYDVDWSYEGIYSETINRTNYVYVSKNGYSERDASGNVIVGLYAGQTVYGGDATGQNLTFNANSADDTGYVQTDNTFRPTVTDTLDLGTSALKFRTGYFSTSVLVDTLSLEPGSITDTSGAISFGDENLTTTGTIQATSITLDTITIAAGSITDTSGDISFGDENLTTTGNISGTQVSGTTGVFGDITISTGSIVATGGNISFGDENLITTGTLSAGDTSVTRLDSDNIRIDGNTISVTNLDGNLILTANGAGIIDLQSAATTLGIDATGVVSITGQLNIDNIRVDGNIISSTDLDGNIELQPNGAGKVVTHAVFSPNVDDSLDLGEAALRFSSLYLSTGIGDGTTVITQPTLQSFRDANVGVAAGMTLFWDGTKWVASAPDTEITHNTLSGLTTGDAGHTQFVMLEGRSGGQTVQGGTASSENLILESTADATKGAVYTADVFSPLTNATFAAGWQGIDLGDNAHYFRDVYTRGEFLGLRFQNVVALPSNSVQNIGRGVWHTGDEVLYIDTGVAWVPAGSSTEKFVSDTVWNGVDTTKDVDVSSTISDARTALWQFCDNANDYERIYTDIKAISATTVRITVNPALPAGSYRLIGIN